MPVICTFKGSCPLVWAVKNFTVAYNLRYNMDGLCERIMAKVKAMLTTASLYIHTYILNTSVCTNTNHSDNENG